MVKPGFHRALTRWTWGFTTLCGPERRAPSLDYGLGRAKTVAHGAVEMADDKWIWPIACNYRFYV